MDILKNMNCKSLSHDLIINGSQSFYNKIPTEDCELPFFVEYPYPIQAALKCPNEMKLNLFQNDVQSDIQKEYYQREFKRMKTEICNQNFQSFAVLPNFFIDYVENATSGTVNYGFNVSFSQGVLQKFYDQNNTYLIRPNADNNLMICNLEMPEREVSLQWLCSDPILNLQNMYNGYSNYFIMSGKNTVHLTEISSDSQVKVHLKLNCNVGYLGTALNYLNKSELAIMDTKNKLKLFDIEKKSVISTYTMDDLNLNYYPRLTRFDYLAEKMMMLMTDKHIKVLDTRCKDIPHDIDLKLEDCDIMLNFTTDKSKPYISNNVYIASKHSYFIYDIRMTSVEDFIHHNLRSPPCFIDYYDGGRTQLITLFSQSPNERAIFGALSPYSLPYHLINLEDTYNKCRSQKYLPVIPDIEKRLNYPITGVQLIPNNDDVSIFYTNIFGELFRQDILQRNSQSGEPIEKMNNWLLELYENNDQPLNVVHYADASAAFELETEEFNEVDLYDEYEKSNVHQFLEDENFNVENCKAEAFLDIWEDGKLNDISLPESEPSSFNKVEDWIESVTFEADKDIE